MSFMRCRIGVFCCSLALASWGPLGTGLSAAETATPANPNLETNALKWDSMEKTLKAQGGQETAHFEFAVHNDSGATVSVTKISTSCGCTVAKMPATPWVLPHGAKDVLKVDVDLKGRYGTIHKNVLIHTDAGYQTLKVNVELPEAPNSPTPAENTALIRDLNTRVKNIQMALGDRQAVFRGDCRECHVDPGQDKHGKELFVASCAICHEAKNRASMVPDLKKPKMATSLVYWKQWVMAGKAGSLMPAFAKEFGGPLTPEQVDSLCKYLNEEYLPEGSVPATLSVPAPPQN